MKAEVLNGWVEAGDTIAYPNRFGSSLDMKIAIVEDVTERPHAWKRGQTVKVLSVKVIKGSDVDRPYRTHVGVLSRVVKLTCEPEYLTTARVARGPSQ